jgi:hypothetical protein
MAEEIQFVADLSGVTEVTLLGRADLDYWGDRLRPHGLTPHPQDGAAQILVSAAQARFMGVPFREVSFSVLVSPGQERHRLQDASCLLRAFSSNRFFAFWERTFFKTPYTPARCEIRAHDPIGIEVARGKATLFSARMGGVDERPASHLEQDAWVGTVAILPAPGRADAAYKYFVAKLSGETTRYPFDGARDRLLVAADSGIPELSQLGASGFAGEQWIVRASANHARSKTFTARI